jgi:serine O-acetyltransferase
MTEPLQDNLSQLTEAVLDSYSEHGPMQRIGETFLPSRSRIVEIIDEVRQLLFPGFFGHKQLTAQNVRYHVGNLLGRLGWDLTDQINHCICTERSCERCPDSNSCRDEAAGLGSRFLQRIPEIRRLLCLDAQAAFDGDPAAKSLAEVIYCYPGFYAVTVYRIAHEFWLLGIPLMARIMTEHAHSVTGTDIHPGATIGEAFFVDHATGVVIGETSEIGSYVKIYQGVTLGARSFPRDERGRLIKGLRRHPKIEDNVTIYANATILGGETVIGRGVTVGGNTFVTESIGAESLVAHEKPKLEVRSKNRSGEGK